MNRSKNDDVVVFVGELMDDVLGPRGWREKRKEEERKSGRGTEFEGRKRNCPDQVRSSARVGRHVPRYTDCQGPKGGMDQSQQLHFEFRDRTHFSTSFFCLSVTHYAMDWAILHQLIMRLSF
jgi:hypothetical protein